MGNIQFNSITCRKCVHKVWWLDRTNIVCKADIPSPLRWYSPKYFSMLYLYNIKNLYYNFYNYDRIRKYLKSLPTLLRYVPELSGTICFFFFWVSSYAIYVCLVVARDQFEYPKINNVQQTERVPWQSFDSQLSDDVTLFQNILTFCLWFFKFMIILKYDSHTTWICFLRLLGAFFCLTSIE